MSDATLYERLGGETQIAKIATDIFDTHADNPDIASRYLNSDRHAVIEKVTEFLCAATGGPQEYTGKSMIETHKTMNINEKEFLAVLDDIMLVLDKHQVGQQEKQELLLAAYSLKGEIIGR
ncbi:MULTISPECIES: group I truncated hemoglobin [Shewanella]|uniref:Group 1 truncated hemoglobin n=1 Tax=Shewanella marisflavi TaxID=260364 RepID=A0AAC9TWE5_9GAMM|nr:group 1 truncated hemoglobin [Shewanella marisflavi]ASJ96150.1 group 1 truncated hemoglobin [Shewanella marisflavi]MCL1041991.1 group 1 truncated hemoglobin [Shewanella marisflavi]